jgi:hypothetical protein
MAEGAQPASEDDAVGSVIVAHEKERDWVRDERFCDLLGQPERGRMSCDFDVEDALSAVR